MIKANELRIGNLVSFLSNELTIIQIKSIIPEKGTHELYEPIPLTEEWLVNFGFKQIEKRFVGNGLYPIFKDNNGYWLGDGEGGTVNDKAILYVHQLQNLFFALIGTELIYKP